MAISLRKQRLYAATVSMLTRLPRCARNDKVGTREGHLPLAYPHIRSLHYTLRVRQQAQGHGPSACITSEYRVHRVQVTRPTAVRRTRTARRISCTAGYRSQAGNRIPRYRIDQYGGFHHRCARVAAPSRRRSNRTYPRHSRVRGNPGPRLSSFRRKPESRRGWVWGGQHAQT